MKVYICEDEPVFQEEIIRAIKQWQIKTSEEIINVKTYTKAEQILFEIDEGNEADLLFLDIELPGISGLELASAIRKTNSFVPIVFISNYAKFLQKGYEVNAYRYLMKPIQETQVFECLDHARKAQSYLHTGFISFHTEESYIRVSLNNFLYLAAENHFARLYTSESGDYLIPVKSRLEELIPPAFSDRVIRCHRGFIVNIQNIQQYSKKKIVLLNKTEIPIGRRYEKAVLAVLNSTFFGDEDI